MILTRSQRLLSARPGGKIRHAATMRAGQYKAACITLSDDVPEGCLIGTFTPEQAGAS
jgi:hypothetical protein